MITYKFTVDEASDPIFQALEGDLVEYLEVPLRIRIPSQLATGVGLDRVQDTITAVIDDAIKTLNQKIS